LADRLAVAPGDVVVVASWLAEGGTPGVGADGVDREVASEINRILQPHCERTVPEAYGQRGTDI
jgi:hypothetical protein